MKKIILSLISASLLAVPMIILAQGGGGGPAVAPTLDVMQTLNNIVNWLFSILLIVAAIFLIIAGYHFIVAQGDPDRLKKARDMVLWSLIGVLTAFAAKGLVVLVERIASN